MTFRWKCAARNVVAPTVRQMEHEIALYLTDTIDANGGSVVEGEGKQYRIDVTVTLSAKNP